MSGGDDKENDMSFDFALGVVCGAGGLFSAFCFLMGAYRAGQRNARKGES